jgi:hypothetical protein
MNSTLSLVLSNSTSVPTSTLAKTGQKFKPIYLLILIPFVLIIAACILCLWVVHRSFGWTPLSWIKDRRVAREYVDHSRRRSLRYENYP